MNKGAYTIKGVDGYHTSSEKNCLAKANHEALKTGQPVRVLLNGDPFMAVVSPKYGFVETSRNERLMYAKRNIFFEPKDTDVKVYTDVAAKYYDLKKYNNAGNFKRLSF